MKENEHILSSLFELAELLSYQSDFQEILRLISDRTLAIFQADVAAITMINPRTQKTIKTVIQNTKKGPLKGLSLVQTNVIGWMMINRQSFFSENIKADSQFASDVFSETSVGSVSAAAIRYNGSIIGYLIIGRRFDNLAFSPGIINLLENISLFIAPYLNNTEKIQDYFNTALPQDALIEKYAAAGLLGKSLNFLELLRAIDAAARCDARVLLEGRTGTGKELIARAIHNFSGRAGKPFVAIDCGAIPENLVESELFGHVKGAFTGAAANRQGLMETANGGTLFIDEIANLPFPMQSKLMRALQENKIRPLGSNETRKIDVRIISAASTSLRDLMTAGKFREDLFYRLYVYPIKVPTLGERNADIPLLANFFLEKIAERQGKKVKQFAPSLIEFINSREWEGNIRELENFVERVVAVVPESASTIEGEMLPADLRNEQKLFLKTNQLTSPHKSLKARLRDHEAQILREALEAAGWHQTRAAKQLNISEQIIRYRMKKLGIKKPE